MQKTSLYGSLWKTKPMKQIKILRIIKQIFCKHKYIDICGTSDSKTVFMCEKCYKQFTYKYRNLENNTI